MKSLLRSLLAVVLVLFPCVLANAQNVAVTLSGSSVSFSWNANAPTGVSGTTATGYKIHIGPSSGNYMQTFDAGNATTSTITTLANGTWFAVVKAYNSLGTESSGSNEVSFTLPALPPTPTPIPTVSPTATPSPTSTPTPTVSPTATPTATPSATPSPTVIPMPTPVSVNIGDTKIESTADNTNQNTLIGQKVMLSSSGTLKSISTYVSIASGNMMLGLYSNNGTIPGTLLSSTGPFAVTNGWNTHTVTPVVLSAGTYWLVFSVDNNTVTSMKNLTGAITYVQNQAYGIMPKTFPTSGLLTQVQTYSFYATVINGTLPTPTPSPTATPTPSSTPVPTSVASFTIWITKMGAYISNNKPTASQLLIWINANPPTSN